MAQIAPRDTGGLHRMVYILAATAFILVAVVAFRTASPSRALAIAGGAGLILLGALFYLADGERDAPPAIDPGQLALSGLKMTADRYGHQLTGDIANRSPRRLGTMTLRVTYRTCPTPEACLIHGEESHEIFMGTAAGRTGHFSVLLGKGELAEKTGASWVVSISAASADF